MIEERETQKFKRPLPINKLSSIVKTQVTSSYPKAEAKASLFYESCIVKLMKEDEIIEKDVDLPQEYPIEVSELQNEEILAQAFNNNFAPVPKTSSKIKITQKKAPKKAGDNFVRATMSRSKSSKKLGKTGCPKHKFRYFTPSAPSLTSDKILYSTGFKNKKRSSFTSLPEILLHEFGFSSWREGQEESINHILSSQNTLSILPTGTGKSLIYQLCSRLLGGLCIVISPLLSLINDQLMRLPSCLSASALYSDISYSHYHSILQQAKSAAFDILYVTPEKFISEKIAFLPNISLICIDEAHCVSKYSKSTRLSYMLLPDLLKNHRVLGLTAAVDSITLQDLQALMRIEKTVSQGRALRENLHVTVSRESDIITAAGKLVHSERFRNGSVIIYCAMQYIADSVAQWLRSKGEACMSYHSALGDYKRNKVQEDFITGRIRIIVATIAFGMGIDKANIRGVVHLHMPYSLEHFIQESGRAGRDGSEAHVHVFISDSSLYFQRALMYSSHITKKLIIKLVKMLAPASLKRCRDEPAPKGPILHLKISETCEEMGLDKERLLALFYYLQSKLVITSVSVNPITATVSFHKTAPELLAEKYAIISQILNTGTKLASSRRISLPELSEKMQLGIDELIKVMKRLAAAGEISTEFTDDAFIVEAGDLPQELRLLDLAKETEEYFSNVEETFRRKIETCFMVLDRVAKDSVKECKNSNGELGDIVEEYLHKGYYDEIPEDEIGDISLDVHCIAAEMEGVPDPNEIACILQGINTKRNPMARWKNYHMWGRYKQFRFLQVYNECAQVLLEDMGKKMHFRRNSKDEEVIEYN